VLFKILVHPPTDTTHEHRQDAVYDFVSVEEEGNALPHEDEKCIGQGDEGVLWSNKRLEHLP